MTMFLKQLNTTILNGGTLPVMVKLSLVQFALDPVEVALRPGEGNRDQAPRSIFRLRRETMWIVDGKLVGP